MTSRERINCVAQGKIPDRVPIWPDAVFYLPMRLRYRSYNAVVWPTLEDKLACAEHFGFEKVVVLSIPASLPLKKESRSWMEGDHKHYETIWHTSAGIKKVHIVHPPDDAPWTINYPAGSIADVPALIETIDISEDSFDIQVAGRQRAELGEEVAVLGNVPDPLGIYMDWRGDQKALFDLMDQPQYVAGILDEILEISLRRVRASAKVTLDGIFAGSNGLSVLSPAIMRRFIFPYLKRIADEAHNLGMWMAAHHHGRLSAVLEDCADYGVDILNPLERFPTGDVDLADAKQRIGKRCTLMGNVGTVTTLLRGTPEEVRLEVKKCMDAAKQGGRFILSTSDQIARDTPLANIEAFVAAGLEFGRYK